MLGDVLLIKQLKLKARHVSITYVIPFLFNFRFSKADTHLWLLQHLNTTHFKSSFCNYIFFKVWYFKISSQCNC